MTPWTWAAILGGAFVFFQSKWGKATSAALNAFAAEYNSVYIEDEEEEDARKNS